MSIDNKAIIFYSGLPLWSMKNGSGAPPFAKTVSLYMNKGWKVYLCTSNEGNGERELIEEGKLFFYENKLLKKLETMKKIGWIVRGIERECFFLYCKKCTKRT